MGEQIILINRKIIFFFYPIFCIFVLFSTNTQCNEKEIKTDGVWGVPKNPTFQWTLEKVIDCFLPFDPNILEIHGSEGSSSQLLANQFPKGKIKIIESNHPDNLDKLFEFDLIRLDNSGFEFLLKKRDFAFFNKPSIFSIKTNFSSLNLETNFYRLKCFLENSGYTLLCHWYYEHSQGEAVFIQKKIYEAIFQ